MEGEAINVKTSSNPNTLDETDPSLISDSISFSDPSRLNDIPTLKRLIEAGELAWIYGQLLLKTEDLTRLPRPEISFQSMKNEYERLGKFAIEIAPDPTQENIKKLTNNLVNYFSYVINKTEHVLKAAEYREEMRKLNKDVTTDIIQENAQLREELKQPNISQSRKNEINQQLKKQNRAETLLRETSSYLDRSKAAHQLLNPWPGQPGDVNAFLQNLPDHLSDKLEIRKPYVQPENANELKDKIDKLPTTGKGSQLNKLIQKVFGLIQPYYEGTKPFVDLDPDAVNEGEEQGEFRLMSGGEMMISPVFSNGFPVITSSGVPIREQVFSDGIHMTTTELNGILEYLNKAMSPRPPTIPLFKDTIENQYHLSLDSKLPLKDDVGGRELTPEPVKTGEQDASDYEPSDPYALNQNAFLTQAEANTRWKEMNQQLQSLEQQYQEKKAEYERLAKQWGLDDKWNPRGKTQEDKEHYDYLNKLGKEWRNIEDDYNKLVKQITAFENKHGLISEENLKKYIKQDMKTVFSLMKQLTNGEQFLMSIVSSNLPSNPTTSNVQNVDLSEDAEKLINEAKQTLNFLQTLNLIKKSSSSSLPKVVEQIIHQLEYAKNKAEDDYRLIQDQLNKQNEETALNIQSKENEIKRLQNHLDQVSQQELALRRALADAKAQLTAQPQSSVAEVMTDHPPAMESDGVMTENPPVAETKNRYISTDEVKEELKLKNRISKLENLLDKTRKNLAEERETVKSANAEIRNLRWQGSWLRQLNEYNLQEASKKQNSSLKENATLKAKVRSLSTGLANRLSGPNIETVDGANFVTGPSGVTISTAAANKQTIDHVNRLTEEVEQLRASLATVQQERTSLSDRLLSLQTEYEELQNRYDNVEDSHARLQSDFNLALDAVAESQRPKDSVINKLKEENQNLSSSLDIANKELYQTVANLASEQLKNVETNRSLSLILGDKPVPKEGPVQALSDLINELTIENQSLKTRNMLLTEEGKQLNSKYILEINQLNTKHQAELERLKANLRETYNREIEKINEDHNKNYQDSLKRFDELDQRRDQQKLEEINNLQDRHNAFLQDLQNEHEKQVGVLQLQYTNEMNELEQKYEKELDLLREHIQKQDDLLIEGVGGEGYYANDIRELRGLLKHLNQIIQSEAAEALPEVQKIFNVFVQDLQERLDVRRKTEWADQEFLRRQADKEADKQFVANKAMFNAEVQANARKDNHNHEANMANLRANLKIKEKRRARADSQARGNNAAALKSMRNNFMFNLIGGLVGSNNPVAITQGYALLAEFSKSLLDLPKEELDSQDVDQFLKMYNDGALNRLVTVLAQPKQSQVDDALSRRISDLENTTRNFINMVSQRTAHVGAAQAYHPPRRVFVGRDGVAHQGNRYARRGRSPKKLPPRRSDGRFKRASPMRKSKK